MPSLLQWHCCIMMYAFSITMKLLYNDVCLHYYNRVTFPTIGYCSPVPKGNCWTFHWPVLIFNMCAGKAKLPFWHWNCREKYVVFAVSVLIDEVGYYTNNMVLLWETKCIIKYYHNMSHVQIILRKLNIAITSLTIISKRTSFYVVEKIHWKPVSNNANIACFFVTIC